MTDATLSPRSSLGRTAIRSLAGGFLAASVAALGFSSLAGAQATAPGLPLHEMWLEPASSNAAYEAALATALSNLLKPDGCLLGFFSTANTADSVYTKYVVVDPATLKYRNYPALRARQRSLLNGDIIKLFKDLRVVDSFLMKSKMREMLFRKPNRS